MTCSRSDGVSSRAMTESGRSEPDPSNPEASVLPGAGRPQERALFPGFLLMVQVDPRREDVRPAQITHDPARVLAVDHREAADFALQHEREGIVQRRVRMREGDGWEQRSK